MPSLQQVLAGALGTALAVTGLSALALPNAGATPAGDAVVISEVYGGGGNSGATLTHDFVELYNPTDVPLSVDGMGVEYKSASGGSGGVVALSGTVPAGGHYLVQLAQGNGGSQALPTPDATGNLFLSASSGRVFLLPTTSPYAGADGDIAGSEAVVDMVGYGSAISYETAAAPGLSNTTSASRAADGTDTDDNAADFTAGTPTPTSGGGGGGDDECPEADAITPIAEIQGPAATSPYVDCEVTTQGVVTARYADPYPAVLGTQGGYDGLYIQTGGTGGGADATPGASDAIFVYVQNDMPDGVEIGDSVEVTGEVGEFRTSTQIDARSGAVTELGEPLSAVTPTTGYPAAEQEREAHEGELFAPGEFTVTNTYITNQYAEIGLAAGSTPLIQPTDVARPGTAAYDDVVADNAARGVVLDDGASVNFLDYGDVEQDIPLPWLTPDHPVRVGDAVTFHQPVILEFRNDTWKFQPTEPVTDSGADVVGFEDTRSQNLAPQDVGGDITLGTFNVLNYFNTTGEEFEANGGSCSYYTDRDGEPVATNRCSNPDGSGGPRGAADAEDLARQQQKIVSAINTMDADVVSLEELENSIKLVGETDRDDAIADLVDALNADAGAGTWEFVASPDAALEPANVAEQDVIRNGFIYQPAAVKPVGASEMLFGHPAFDNAREPLAQTFKPLGNPADKFTVIVNHFKSKGCSGAAGDNADAGDGQACYNGDRVRQAQALVDFADQFAERRGGEKVLLTGDFNAYTEEDPMQVLYDAGYGVVESDQAGDWSYSFSGLSGSLDHVLANGAAAERVTGADVWEINANEAVAYQYSRYNYNATDFHDPGPFAASDHNPEVVGIDVPQRGRR